MAVKSVPEGYHTATPYLIVHDAAAAIEFYKKAFGATELMRFETGGKIGHAEIKIGDSPIMLADEHPEVNALSPKTIGGSPVSLMIYVGDVDSVVARARAAGAEIRSEVKNQFYGDRSGTLSDPFGHTWTIATHVEDVSMEEMRRRMQAAGGAGSSG